MPPPIQMMPPEESTSPTMLNYATSEEMGENLARARVLIAVFASAQILIASLMLLPILGATIDFRLNQLPFVSAWMMFAVLPLSCGLCMLLNRNYRGWRIVRALLGVESVIMLLLHLTGCSCAIVNINATGWNGLIVVLAICLAIAASVPFWLSLLNTVYLMRPASRMIFHIDQSRRFVGRRQFVRILWITWVASTATTLFVYVLSGFH